MSFVYASLTQSGIVLRIRKLSTRASGPALASSNTWMSGGPRLSGGLFDR
jgi:hypothetical protein